jgi:hypothetical protein
MYTCTSWIAISRHPGIFAISSVCFHAKQLTHFLLNRLALIAFRSSRSSTTHHFTVQPRSCSLIHSTKRCCYRKSLPEGVLRIRIFLVCIPLALQQNVSFSNIIYSSWYCSYNTDTTLFRPSHYILLLKGTKYHLSVYDKMQMLNFLKCQCYFSVQFPPYSRRAVWNLR